MPLFNLTDLLASLGPDQRVIGLDPGAKTIGLALSDVRRRLASPYGSLKRGKLIANATEIATIALKEGYSDPVRDDTMRNKRPVIRFAARVPGIGGCHVEH